MPFDIKKAIFTLVLSCGFTLLAVYFDGLEIQEIGYGNPLIFGINIIWVLVIAWIIWDLLKGKNIKPTLIVVGVIILASVVWDIYEFGFGMPQICYLLELAMLVATYIFSGSEESEAWRIKKAL